LLAERTSLRHLLCRDLRARRPLPILHGALRILLLLVAGVAPLLALKLTQLAPLIPRQAALGLQILDPLLIVVGGRRLLLIGGQVLLRVLLFVAAKLPQLAAFGAAQAALGLQLLQTLLVAVVGERRLLLIAALVLLRILALGAPQLSQLASLVAAQPPFRFKLLQPRRLRIVGHGARRDGLRLHALLTLLDGLLAPLGARRSARRGRLALDRLLLDRRCGTWNGDARRRLLRLRIGWTLLRRRTDNGGLACHRRGRPGDLWRRRGSDHGSGRRPRRGCRRSARGRRWCRRGTRCSRRRRPFIWRLRCGATDRRAKHG
jgi:hypothetical protein